MYLSRRDIIVGLAGVIAAQKAPAMLIGARGIAFKDGSSAPHTVLEYIEGTGTQWIDTGYIGGEGTGFEADIQLTSYQSEKGLFGCLSEPRLCYILAGSSLRCDVGDGSSARYSMTTGRRTLKYNAETDTVTDSLYQSLSWDDHTGPVHGQCSDSITLFVDKRDGAIVSSSRITSMKIFSFKIYQNGEVVMDLIPVSSNGEIMMYDLVGGSYFRNSGSGMFVGG